MRAAFLAAVAALAAAGGADAQTTSTDFRTCRRIQFNEPILGENGSFQEDSFLAQFGMRVVIRNSPGRFTRGIPTGNDYTNHAKRPGAIFDTARPTGRDVDLGSPNFQCDATCPAGYESCPICLGAGPLADPRVRETFLPAGHPGCGDPSDPDFLTCPGVGCGGGFWLQEPAPGSPTPTVSYTYPDVAADGTVTPRPTTREQCVLKLDEDGCPQTNPAMNCRNDGKVIIVQERVGDEPDDNASGGVISFIFDQDIELLGLSVLDMDDVQGTSTFPGYVYGMTSPDESVNTPEDFARVAPLFGGGDNSLDDIEVYYPDVRRVVVWLRGSGSVNDIEYCAGAPPNVEVTTEADCTYTWSIEKTVNQEQWPLFAGQSTNEVFTTTVTRSEECELSPIRSSGSITVGSPSGRTHRIVDVIGGFDRLPNTDPDTVTDRIGSFSCSPFTPTPDRPYVLVAEDGASVTIGDDTFEPANTLTCSFDTEVADGAFREDGSSFLKVEFTSSVDDVFTGPSLVAFGSVMQPESPTLVDAAATVTDDGGDGTSFTTSETTTFESTRVQECGKGDEESNPYDFTCTSTVTPVDSGVTLSASASTSRQCYDLEVSKTAAGTATRAYSWTIEKTAMPATGADETALDLDSGDDAVTVKYQLTATHSSEIVDVQLTGSVTVSNHHPGAEAVISLADLTFPSAEWTGDGCTASGEGITIAAGGSVTCDYTVELDAIPEALSNVAEATQQYGVSYTGSADFEFEITSTGQEATITDQFEGEDAAVLCSGTSAAPSFTCFINRMYSPDACEDPSVETVTRSVRNTGTVSAADGTPWDSDEWNTVVTTTCQRCADCQDEKPMYPMDLERGIYRITSAEGEKKITLCWD